MNKEKLIYVMYVFLNVISNKFKEVIDQDVEPFWGIKISWVSCISQFYHLTVGQVM